MNYPQLLYLNEEDLIISLFADPNKKDDVLNTFKHRPEVKYNEKMAPGLKNLGLYQIARMQNCPIDPSLITALVERWRPETNNFHLPFGEMTVTLEDVCILWGLPIQGKAITGISDEDWSIYVTEYLGLDMTYDGVNPKNMPWRYKHRRGEYEPSKYHIRFSHMRSFYKEEIPDNADQLTVDRWTRVFCMDLFGSIMFPDKTGDCVAAMYLQFIRRLDRPANLNWGNAVLAYLYRQLSEGCLRSVACISGPLLLLQMWSWTRFPIGRPSCRKPHLPLGGPDPLERHAYGVKWTIGHLWKKNTHSGGTSHFRADFTNLSTEVVHWCPYNADWDKLNEQVHKDSDWFKARGPLIHFWIVTQHYPDRVMKQFGLYQQVPQPAPESWEWHEEYNKIKHNSKSANKDWGDFHEFWINKAMIFIDEQRSWAYINHDEYEKWYMQRGMVTVYVRANNDQVLEHPHENPTPDQLESLPYQDHGYRDTRLLFRMVRQTAQGIQWVKTPGQEFFGKQILKTAKGAMNDLGHSPLFLSMVRAANLPDDPHMINLTTDQRQPDGGDVDATTEEDEWNLYQRDPEFFTNLLASGLTTQEPSPSPTMPTMPSAGEGTSSQASPRPCRVRQSPCRFTYPTGQIRKQRGRR